MNSFLCKCSGLTSSRLCFCLINLLLLATMAHVQGGPTLADVQKHLESDFYQKLDANTYKSLRDRVEPDGISQELLADRQRNTGVFWNG